MQFTVLIEFLVPGLATTLLALALLPANSVPQLSQGIPSGDTASTLLLLAISYPVGILTNFPIFMLLQKRLISPWGRRSVIRHYNDLGIDLVKTGNQRFGLSLGKGSGDISREDMRELFNLMRALVFRENIDRLNANHLYHEGLQRLARGMLLPLVLAIPVVWRSNNLPNPVPTLLLSCFLFISVALLVHSVRTEDAQIAHFFLTSSPLAVVRSTPPSVTESADSDPGQEKPLVSAANAPASPAS